MLEGMLILKPISASAEVLCMNRSIWNSQTEWWTAQPHLHVGKARDFQSIRARTADGACPPASRPFLQITGRRNPCVR